MHYNKYIDVYHCIINKYLKNAFIPWLKPWAFSLFNCVKFAEADKDLESAENGKVRGLTRTVLNQSETRMDLIFWSSRGLSM